MTSTAASVRKQIAAEQKQDKEDKILLKREQYSNMVSQWKNRKRTVAKPGTTRFRTNFRNTILDVFRERGWEETKSETDWDIFWTDKQWIRGVYDRVHLDNNQRVNHFRNYYEIARKDCLIKNLKRTKRTLARKGRIEESEQYDFFPNTFAMPGEYSLFVEAFKKNPDTCWIMKPIGKSQGKGIFLFDKLHQINDWKNDNRWKPESPQAEKYVVQQYISNPLLIGGKKFDLRIYVLVTSYQPLTAFLYREGFARFSSSRFSMLKGDIENTYIHLTNVAVQKKGPQYDAVSGGKMDLRTLKLYVHTKHGAERANKMMHDIQLVCIRALLAVQKVIINDKQSFELYGYDILIDANLKPWLLEVNASPSLTANTPDDYALKMRLLHDTITIVDIDGKLTGTEDQVGGFDLIYRSGYVKFDPNCTYSSYLGCHNNRKKQLAKLAKSLQKLKAGAAGAGAGGGGGAGSAGAAGAGASGLGLGGTSSAADREGKGSER